MDDKTLMPIIMWAVNLPAIIMGGFFLLFGGYFWFKGAFNRKPRAGLAVRLPAALGVSLFAGLMVATAGGAVYPSLLKPAAQYICDGKVSLVSKEYSYKPGQQGVSRNVYCTSADGQEKSIILSSIGAATVFFSLLIFATYLVPALLMLPFTVRKSPPAISSNANLPNSEISGKPIVTTSATINGKKVSGNVNEAIQNFFGEQMTDEVQKAISDALGDSRAKLIATLSGKAIEPDNNIPDSIQSNVVTRLSELKMLHDKGLINTLEYEKKRQEIIDEL